VEAKPVGRLRVTFYEIPRMAYMLLSTTSVNDIIAIGGPDSGELGAIQNLCNQLRLPFSGVPLILYRKERSISYTDANGKQSSMKRWLIHIEADPEFVERAMLKSRELAMPSVALINNFAESARGLSGVNEPELLDEEEEMLPPEDMGDVEDGEVKEEAPKTAEEKKPAEPEEKKYRFNDGVIVVAVAKAMNYKNNEASNMLFEARQKERIPEYLTVSQAKEFCAELIGLK
jgi:hypothetical protein